MLTAHALEVLLILACCAFFQRAGEVDGYSGVVWGGLSVLVSLTVWLGLQGGFFGILLGQIGLFVAITLYRVRREP
jgi:hypothetical protein